MAVKLTRRGWSLLLASSLSSAAALATGDPILLASGLMGILVLGFSFLYAKRIHTLLSRTGISRATGHIKAVEGSRVRIAFRLEAPRGLPKGTVVRDSPPRRLAVIGEPEAPVEGGPGGVVEAWYEAKPSVGSHRWSEVEVYAESPGGLAVASVRNSLPILLEAAPSPRALEQVRLRLATMTGYSKPVNRRWPLGYEFLELREYQPGDDPRMIHWPSTARAGTLVVRETAMETRLNLTIVLDASGEMWIGGPGASPIDHAARLTLALAALAWESGGTASVFLFNGWSCFEARRAVDTASLATVLSKLDVGHGRSTEGLAGCARKAASLKARRPLIIVTGPAVDLAWLVKRVEEPPRPPTPITLYSIMTPTGESPEERLVRAETLRQAEAAGSRRVVAGGWLEAGLRILETLEAYSL
ncbi:conserved hypothetical protein [Aeropyrum pernix]|uniref:DUF58 domain-containing protein n=1 Tax=Aeropyrum pernix TaxID=56636 RepID=A0A401H9C6_AERPX|nr:conserved hypothetical protein [Aeropyrum pernix]